MSSHPLEATCARLGCGAVFWKPHERSNQVYCCRACAVAVRLGYGHRRTAQGRSDAPCCSWPTPINVPRMLELYASGKSVRQIGHAWGKSPAWVFRLFRNAGVELRLPWEASKGRLAKRVLPEHRRPLPAPPQRIRVRTWPIGALPPIPP